MKSTATCWNAQSSARPTSFGLLLVMVTATSSLGCEGVGGRDKITEDPSIGIELDLRIDGYRADLVAVHWMGVSPNGTIALTQVQDNNLRFFDSEGTDLGSVGRAGSGPGEFARPFRGGWLADTLWVSDVAQERITLISPELDVVRTLPPLPAAVPRPEDSDRLPVFVFVFPYALYRGDVALAFAMGSAGDPLAQAFKGQPLIRVASDGESRATRPGDSASPVFPCRSSLDPNGQSRRTAAELRR